MASSKNGAKESLPKWALEGWTSFTEAVGPQPFRLSALTKLLYPKTNPRSRDRAQRIAARLIQRAYKAGEIGRQGHLHWIRLTRGRRLKSGRTAPEHAGLHRLQVQTHCPEKYVLVDLETACLWQGTPRSWVRAGDQGISDARAVLGLLNAQQTGVRAEESQTVAERSALVLPLEEKELRVLEQIASRKDMTRETVMRQALRWLQILEETDGAYPAVNALRPSLGVPAVFSSADSQSRRDLAVCLTCRGPLDVPGDPSTRNCGGDCVRCMANSGDPDCIQAMKEWRAQRRNAG